jgi:hypothetical protein
VIIDKLLFLQLNCHFVILSVWQKLSPAQTGKKESRKNRNKITVTKIQ